MNDSHLSPLVGIVMGSDSDWPKIRAVGTALDQFDVPWEERVISAHRTPEVVREYAATAAERGLKVIIGAAGGAAHLAGVVAAHTTLPVVGIPVPTPDLGGLDSLLSTVQMPGDVPVVSVAVGMGGPRNAGLFAVQILALSDARLAARLVEFKQQIAARVAAKDRTLTEAIRQDRKADG
jgi:5-(carboxyamino)imidazole ribonucleotide mutase